MDKKELLKFLKDKEATEDLMKFAESLNPVTNETVKGYLTNEAEGQKLLKSLTDSQVTKGIETFKEKTMPNLIEEEIKKQFPAETEDQKKLRELELKQQKLEKEISRKELLNKALTYATEKKYPTKFLDRFIGDDEETTIKNIDSFGQMYQEAITNAVEDKFKSNGRESVGSSKEGTPDLTKMSDEEYIKYRIKEGL